LSIKRDFIFSKRDFDNVCRLVLLYIALNNDLSIINEELELFGISTQQPILPETSNTNGYEYSKVLENYRFWNNQNTGITGHANIFQGISENQFIKMIDAADFSKINKKGISQRIKYNIVVLARLLGEEWGEKAAKNLGTTLRDCSKMTTFTEHNDIKAMFLQ
jgi:hypothetical protein